MSAGNGSPQFTTEIHFGKQRKHLTYSRGFIKGKSQITVDIVTLQSLVEQKAGTGHWENDRKETVNPGQIIGSYHNEKTGTDTPTSWVTIHYSTTGLHVVPADPNHPKRKAKS